MIARPDPLTLPAPAAPDADYETLRGLALSVVEQLAAGTWTDHNAADPGITLMEAMAWGAADLHYRTAVRGLDDWPLPAPATGALLPGDAADVVKIARTLATPADAAAGAPSLGASLVTPVLEAPSRGEAQRLVLSESARVQAPLTAGQADACVGLLRTRSFQRAALELSGVVESAVADAARTLPANAPRSEVEEAAKAILEYEPRLRHLWEDELQLLLDRQALRAARALVGAVAAELRSAETATAVDAAVAPLFAASLSTTIIKRARALAPAGDPTTWQTVSGEAVVWPPTRDQALRCEPVTGNDYAIRARTATEVLRAWTVRGCLPGIGWDGQPTVVTDRPGTLTLLVERIPDHDPDISVGTFLRTVLQEAIGEINNPYDLYETTTPRRLLGEEIGVALLRHHPVIIEGILHVPPGTDFGAVRRHAHQRVEAFFRTGRAEGRRTESMPEPGLGPWPSDPQPPTGWTPGEAISVTELVQVLAADPAIAGVSRIRAAVKDGPTVRKRVRVVARSHVAATGTPTVEGLSLAAGDRILLTAQNDQAKNGVYIVATGAWTRAADLASAETLCDAIVQAKEGPEADKAWELVTDAPIKVDVTEQQWIRSTRRVAFVKVVATQPTAASGQPMVDGVRLFVEDRVLLTAQPNPADNGLYVVRVGAWTRDTTSADRLPGAAVRVREGSQAGTTWWLSTLPLIQIGITPQTWVRTAAPQPADARPTGSISIPAGGVPILATLDCLQVRTLAGSEVSDA